jgi:hypothetical protein
MPNKLRLDIEARQTELVNRQHGDLLFRQFVEQRHRGERVTGLLHGLIENRTIFSGQMQQIDHLVQLLINISGAFMGDDQVVTGRLSASSTPLRS